MALKKGISHYLSKIGKKGGEAGTGKAKARTSEQARQAVLARWNKKKDDVEKPADDSGVD